jgi:hypothetical protein
LQTLLTLYVSEAKPYELANPNQRGNAASLIKAD